MQPILFNFALVFGIMMALKFLPGPSRKTKLGWARLARNRRLSLVLAALIPVAIHLAFYPRPEPSIHDEFSYLLQADTFAHGRLANPTPALWPHFEQYHVLARPTFSSKYPPLQGALLAAGEVLGNPYYGLLLSSALLFAALLWMFYGWLPPSYALLAWVIALAKMGPSTYWMNSYWGGSAAALGGALVLGAWPRLARLHLTVRKENSPGNGLLFGLGVVLLAFSRPYEGLLISGITVLALAWLGRTQTQPNQTNQRQTQTWHWLRWAVPVVSAGLLFLAYYNRRVTGDALRMPYVVHQQQYEVAGYFLFQHDRLDLPVYHNEIYRVFWTMWVPGVTHHYQTHLAEAFTEKLRMLWVFFYTDWPLSLSLLALPLIWRNRRLRWAGLMLAIFLLGFFPLIGTYPHYVAPAAGLLMVLMIGGLHRIRLWNPQGKPTGSVLARVAMAAVFCLFARDVVYRDFIQKTPVDMTGNPALKATRRRLIEQLQKQPGRHLVLVRYEPGHDPGFDYVANGADPETQKILWARELDPASNEELMRHFAERHIWRMNGDQAAPQLEPVGIGAETALPVASLQQRGQSIGAPGDAVRGSR
jgi:hypothetical protein